MNAQITDTASHLRTAWADALRFALDHCDRHDAAALCAGFLEAVETGGPLLGDPFGMTAGDARLWAASAPPHELVAYTGAGLERLPTSALSAGLRKAALKALWRSLTDQDRAGFLRAVKGGR